MEVNPLSIATSILYPVAPIDEFQFAVKLVWSGLEAEVAIGLAGAKTEVGANPCSIDVLVPEIVPTASSPMVQVKENVLFEVFSPALESVCLLNEG